MALRCGALLFLSAFVVAGAQELPWQSSGSSSAGDPVRYEYPEQVQLTAGRSQQVDLHFRIRGGLHINSHQPLDKSLVRTDLVVAEPSGIDVQSVTFPEGEPYSSAAFPREKLSVYTGEVVLHARILAARPGEQLLSAALRYQACDANTCFPPKKATVALDVVAR